LPKICVSIAVEDPEVLKMDINRAFGFGADYIEIRFDYLNLSDMEQVIKIAELVRTKSVFTLRAPEEEGKFKGSTTERILWLKKLSLAKPMLLDVEFKTIKDNTDFADYLEKQKIPLLVSWHDFEKTVTISRL
jgi:3-dehydroquinate dehydratase-1